MFRKARPPKLWRVLSRIAAARPFDAPPWRLTRDLARSSLDGKGHTNLCVPLGESHWGHINLCVPYIPKDTMAASPNQSLTPTKLTTRRSLPIEVCTKDPGTRFVFTHPSLQVPIFYLQPQSSKIVFFYLATSMRRRAPAVWRPGYQHSHTESGSIKVFRIKKTK